MRAAQQVLAARVPMAALNADVLKSAVEGSGVMLEAVLAKGAAPSIGDAKVGLLVLRAALTSWLGDLAPVEPVRRVPPPIKGETLRAQITEPLSDLPASARDVGRVLHGHAEAALSRLKLMQLASLPDSDANRQSGPELRLELPLMVGSELAMAQLQIFRDGKRNREAARRGWTVRFAVATAATGEVGAEIGLTGRTINVALWAAEEVTAIAMARTLPELDERLGRLGLTSTIRMRAGPPRGSRTPPGQVVDRGS
ncbi:MAG TPA: hypothetical protein VG757_14555 [Devosia sp.]|nr:hypothetical protein [Devosia sp.]